MYVHLMKNEYLSMKHLLYGRLQDYTNEIHWENHDTIYKPSENNEQIVCISHSFLCVKVMRESN